MSLSDKELAVFHGYTLNKSEWFNKYQDSSWEIKLKVYNEKDIKTAVKELEKAYISKGHIDWSDIVDTFGEKLI